MTYTTQEATLPYIHRFLLWFDAVIKRDREVFETSRTRAYVICGNLTQDEVAECREYDGFIN